MEESIEVRQLEVLERIAVALEAIAAVQYPMPRNLTAEKQDDGTWRVAGWDGDPKLAHLAERRFYSKNQAEAAIREAVGAT